MILFLFVNICTFACSSKIRSQWTSWFSETGQLVFGKGTCLAGLMYQESADGTSKRRRNNMQMVQVTDLWLVALLIFLLRMFVV